MGAGEPGYELPQFPAANGHAAGPKVSPANASAVSGRLCRQPRRAPPNRADHAPFSGKPRGYPALRRVAEITDGLSRSGGRNPGCYTTTHCATQWANESSAARRPESITANGT